MLDDHGLRLLAEIGVDVYLPRHAAPGPGVVADGAAPAAVAFVAAHGQGRNLRGHVLLALRATGLRVIESDGLDLAQAAGVVAVVVLGEGRARTLGAGLPAARHAALEWVIADEPATLARSAASRRALWGEIKRLARTLAARG